MMRRFFLFLMGETLGLKEAALINGQLDRLQRIEQLFAGGPDTPCRTTWRKEIHPDIPAVECVEVPLDDLREALGSNPT